MAALYIITVFVAAASIAMVVMAVTAFVAAMTWRMKETEKIASAARIRKLFLETEARNEEAARRFEEKMAEALLSSVPPQAARKGAN